MSSNFSQSVVRHGIIILLALALLVFTLYASMLQWLDQPLEIEEVTTVELSSGSNSRQIAQQLHQQGIVKYPAIFTLWTRLTNVDRALKAGEYELQPKDTLGGLLERMQRGETRQYAFTLIEGWNFKQLRAALDAHPQVIHTLDGVDDAEVMQLIGSFFDHPEGQFLPDTYYIEKDTRDVDLLKRAHDAMTRAMHEEWNRRDKGLPFNSPYDALILASIVEKESAVPEERPIIAGVFVNRLFKDMRLQTDPTVIYGMGDEYDGDIRFKDLRKDTPYNTYTRSGLPPTPIAMPGIEALRATMHPTDTLYLYFVAHSDRSGRHLFSSTLEQHEAYVDEHQRGK